MHYCTATGYALWHTWTQVHLEAPPFAGRARSTGVYCILWRIPLLISSKTRVGQSTFPFPGRAVWAQPLACRPSLRGESNTCKMEPFDAAVLVVAANHFPECHLVAKAIRRLIRVDSLVVDKAAVAARSPGAVAAELVVVAVVALQTKNVKSSPFLAARTKAPQTLFLQLDFRIEAL